MLVVPDGQHSWLYEFPEYRRTVASFLARTLGGPVAADEAGELAAAADARRLPDTPRPDTAIQREPGGVRSLLALAIPGRRAGQGIGDVEEEAGPATPTPAPAPEAAARKVAS
jgi:hypothetical protein